MARRRPFSADGQSTRREWGIRNIRRRVIMLFAFTLAAYMALVLRVAWIQFVRGAELSQGALENRLQEIQIQARRGPIYDRQGRELAVSVTVDSVYAIPAEVTDAQAEASTLASLLGMDTQTVLAKLTQKSAFVWVKRKIDLDTAEKVRQAKLPGIDLVPESQRYYPQGSLAAQIIGIAGIDNQGLEGVELEYDQQLRGENGAIVVERDARGVEIPQAVHRAFPAQDGDQVFLTIDEYIQLMAERELDEIDVQYHPKDALILVMDPRNGEILALAQRPTYDPNNYQQYPAANRRNIAVSDVVPPGSIFKPVTAAAALEEGTSHLTDTYYDPGYTIVTGVRINDWKAGGHGHEDFAQAIANSCNVALVSIGLSLGAQNLYKYVDAFHLREKTSIDLPGEASGIFPPLSQVKPIDLAVMSFGQTLTVTPVEMAAAIAAIVNGGVWHTPHVVKEIRSPDGQKVLQSFTGGPGEQVISPATSQDMVKILEGVVTNGTGTTAKVPSYRVGGKTGTSQKVEGGAVVNKYISSFIGFGPIPDPRLLVLVMVDEPQGQHFGSQVAAPAFSRLMGDALRYLGIPPQEPIPGVQANGTAAGQVTVPDVRGLSRADAIARLGQDGLGSEFTGQGSTVVAQFPPPGASVSFGARVLLTLGQAGASNGSDLVAVPDLVGMDINSAARVLAGLGLKASVSGSGRVVLVDPAPGVKLSPGSTVRLEASGGG